MSLKIKF
jgi:hypothetical protein